MIDKIEVINNNGWFTYTRYDTEDIYGCFAEDNIEQSKENLEIFFDQLF